MDLTLIMPVGTNINVSFCSEAQSSKLNPQDSKLSIKMKPYIKESVIILSYVIEK